MSFLPIKKEEMTARGWEAADFVYVTGDAYVDHPSFGPAIICRLLEKHGYKVGIIPQPDWHTTKDFDRLGKPRLGFLVSAGNMDSLLNKFTAAKKVRHEDAYSPGGQAGHRPERATIVYCNRLRELYPDVPIIIGGIEASLRRFAHYDYWDDQVRRAILFDAPADLLVYGMGERATREIARRLTTGRLICIDRDLLMIPSVAIHMNRDANEGASYNVQNDMCPVFGDADAKGGWKKLIAQEAGVDEEQVLDMDLFLSPARHICRAE